MADVSTRIGVTFKDEWGIETSAQYFAMADDSKTIAALDTEVGTFLTDLQAVTDALITQARVTLLVPVPEPTGTPSAGSRVEETAVLGFGVTGTKRKYSALVPAPAAGDMSGDRLTLGSGGWATLIALLTAVRSGGVLQWVSDHQQQIIAFVDALVAYHKKRKQLQRSSFEV